MYFAVAKAGDAPTDGKTDVNPEGLTAAYGPHAEAVAARLHAAGLSCAVRGAMAGVHAEMAGAGSAACAPVCPSAPGSRCVYLPPSLRQCACRF